MDKTKQNLREIFTGFIFIIFIGLFFVLNIIIPAPDVLVAERRIPAKFPDFSLNTIASGSFMSKFDDYAADRFVYRDTFRAIHSFFVLDVYRQSDISGLYRDKEIGLGEFRKTDEIAYRLSSEKIKRAADALAGRDLNVYYSLIPDKSIYGSSYIPGFDLTVAQDIICDVLSDYTYIDIADMLTGSAYYKTDLHWNQTKITHIADFLLRSMDDNNKEKTYIDFTLDTPNAAGDFYGLYTGQIALKTKPDILTYVSAINTPISDDENSGGLLDFSNLKITYLNEVTLELEDGVLYDFERFEGIDPYDFYLRGPQPLVIIENDSVPSRELYLFRDSFGSSLAPLLISSYSKITVIDLRYIHFSLIEMFIEYTPGSDVLFIYGSQILNNPSVLQT